MNIIQQKIRDLLTLDDLAEEKLVIDGIRSAVEFRGAKLWILTLAIFIASLGLNINSAAVIIGAMLISPLMGPIIGMGLGMAIYDSQLLRRSVRNYVVATLFSVVAATLYFLISPYSVAQSELLARTSPTIYDVLIAFSGGLAGIIALSSSSQRQGNVIPGVAIATALMPPLCTIGFGIAAGNLHYIFGALYLYVINSIFIALATFMGSSFIMKFHAIDDPDPSRQKRTRRVVSVLALLTIVPAVLLTVNMIRETYYTQQVNLFLQQEMRWNKTQVVTYRADYDNRTLSVVLIGEELDSIRIDEVEKRLVNYGLEDVSLQIVQSASGVDEEELQSIFDANRATVSQHEALIAQQQSRISELESRLAPYEGTAQLGLDVLAEMQLLWPTVTEIAIGRGVGLNGQDEMTPEMMAIVYVHRSLKKDEEERIRSWLNTRLKQDCRVCVVHIK